MKSVNLPADIFENDALIAAAGRFGAGADSCALRLYFAVCKNGYYLRWDECQAWKFLRFLPKAISVDEIDIFVEKLAEWGFFDYETFKNCGVLTNLDIQRRYFRAPSRRQNLDKLPYILADIRRKYAEPAPMAETPSDFSGRADGSDWSKPVGRTHSSASGRPKISENHHRLSPPDNPDNLHRPPDTS